MPTITVTEANIFTALGTFVNAFVGGAGVEVVRGLANRTPLPQGEPIVMSPSVSMPLATPVTTFDDATQTQSFQESTQFNVQLDFYGAGAYDRAKAMAMVLRTAYACEQLAASGFEIQPLYAGEPKQLPLTSGEQQYIERWTFDAVLQYNPRVSVPQESAIVLVGNVLNVPVTYPPGA